MSTPPPTPKLGAIAVVYHQKRFLLVQRGKDPGRGLWGFPGGHVELGETALAAAQRELAEETGVAAKAVRYLTNVDVISHAPDGSVAYQYLIAAVACDYLSGTAVAADDAAAVRWVSTDDLIAAKQEMSPDVIRVAQLMLAHCSNDHMR